MNKKGKKRIKKKSKLHFGNAHMNPSFHAFCVTYAPALISTHQILGETWLTHLIKILSKNRLKGHYSPSSSSLSSLNSGLQTSLWTTVMKQIFLVYSSRQNLVDISCLPNYPPNRKVTVWLIKQTRSVVLDYLYVSPHKDLLMDQ